MITIMSILISIVYIKIYFSNSSYKVKLLECIVVAAFVHICAIQGYYIKAGGKELTYDMFVVFMTCFFFVKLINCKEITVDKNFFRIVFLFFVVVFASVFYEIFFPYSNFIMDNNTTGPGWDGYLIGQTVKTHATVRYLSVLSYIFCVASCVFVLYLLKEQYDKEDLLYIIKKINKYMWVVLLICFIEFIIKDVLKLDIYSTVIEFILGLGGNTFSGLLERGDLYQLQGLSREPAHLAYMLYWGIVFQGIEYHILENKRIDRNYVSKLILSVFLLIASGSFSAYIYILILLLVASLNFKNKKLKYGFISFFVGVLIVGIYLVFDEIDTSTYLGQRIEFVIVALDAINNEQFFGFGSNSALARFVSMYDTAKDFLQRPLLGLGPVVQVSHGGLVNFLSDVGILGFFVWCRCLISVHKYNYGMLIILLIFPNVIMGVLTINTAFALYTPLVVEAFRK